MDKYLSIFIFLWFSTELFAQTDPQVTNGYMIRGWYNPAFTAIDPDQMQFSFLLRSQFTGFEDSPSTQILYFSTRYQNIGGVGASVSNDNLGFQNRLAINLNIARDIIFGDLDLRFGFGLGLINMRLKGSELIYLDPDPNAINSDRNEFLADFNFGLGFDYKKLSVGFSLNHFTSSKDKNEFFNVPVQSNIDAMYNFSINEKLSLMSYALFQTSFFVSKIQLTNLLFIDEQYFGGLTYRTDKSASIHMGVKLKKKVDIIYSFDYLFQEASNLSRTSNEIVISYIFNKRNYIYKSPRYL